MGRQQSSKSPNGLSRRQFIQGTGKAAAAIAIGQSISTRTRGANERLGIGFIGCGGRGNSHLKIVHWLKTSAKEPVELVAACDAYRPRMQKAVDAYGAKGYMDHRELLADPNVDAVCIATCDHQHGQQAIDAVRAGKDVYCEKPVTHWRQFELTKKLAAEVKKSGRVFQLGTQGNNNQATGKRGSGKRIPVIRGWEGSLTIQEEKIVFIPTLGSDKKPQTFDIEHGEDFTEYWRQFIACCRSGNPQTLSPADLAYHVQTALQMGMLGLKEEKVAKFDPINEKIIL